MYKLTLRKAPAILAASLLLSSIATAQDGSFADDFSVDSTRYSSETFDDSSGIFSADVVNGAVQLTSTGTADGRGVGLLVVQDSSDSIVIDAEVANNSTLFLDAILYSDTPPADDGINVGDTSVTLAVDIGDSGSNTATYCFARRDANNENLPIGEFGTEFCNRLEGVDISAGETHTYGLTLDRENSTFTIMLDDTSQTLSLPEVIYPAEFSLKRIQSSPCCEQEGTSLVTITGIRTGNFSDDFSIATPIFDRYEPLQNDNDRTGTLENEQLRLSAISGERGNGSSLRPLIRTDYFEATGTLSSESVFNEGRQTIYLRMVNVFYNDTADGTDNGDDETGDVRGDINIIADADGSRRAEFCLRRSDDAESDNRTGLLADGESCQNLLLVPEFDEPYRMSMELDRNIPAMIFRLNGFTETVAINTATFQPARGRQEVSVHANQGATVVGFFDDVRTAPQALTASETAAGLTAPADFPPEQDLSALEVNSALPTPFVFDNTSTLLDFTDDFSGNEYQFGFWGGGAGSGDNRGDSGVQYVDGAIQMQTNSAPDNLDGNWTEFYINDDSDSLKARVSLSSSSELPPNPDADAQIQIRATFVNDTQDGGFDGREGDIESGIQLRIRGDGRRELNINLRRRNADGSSESLQADEIVELEPVDSITPELDTVYELGVAVDRERQVLIFSVDDIAVEYQLPSQAFEAARPVLLVSTNHSGSSGVAIANLHSVTTDNIDQDFAIDPPDLAPYWPTFQAQQPGYTVQVVDGRLRLEADATQSTGNGPFFVAHGLSDFVGATIELSSESNVLPDGETFIRVGTQFYNDTNDGGTGEDSVGDVFSELRIENHGDGELFVSYCTIRIDDADFDTVTELVSGDPDNCPRMSTVPALDTPYSASITIDRGAATIAYQFADETVFYNITTGVFLPARTFPGVAVRTTDGSKVVGFVDDLAFDPNPVPLSDSSSLLGSSAGNNGSGSAGNNISDDDPIVSMSSGGGGCSIHGEGGNGLHWLALLASIGIFARRRRSVQSVLS